LPLSATTNFRQDMIDHIVQTLPHAAADRAELLAHPVDDLIAIYLNWVYRTIRPRPRRVHRSGELAVNPLASSHAAALAGIEADFAAGNDVTKYLSRSVAKDGFVGKVTLAAKGNRKRPVAKSPQFDLMLIDWGVHHLHLGTVVEADGFIQRTKPVLFAAVRADDVYFIDIFKHGDWSDQRAVEVLVGNWPDAELVHELKGASGLAHPVSKDDRKQLRENAINSFVEFNGKVYVGPGGMVANGLHLQARRTADRIMIALEEVEEKLTADPLFFDKKVSELGGATPAELSLKFVLADQGVGLYEPQLKLFLKLVN
jgi:hypothetical protein